MVKNRLKGKRALLKKRPDKKKKKGERKIKHKNKSVHSNKSLPLRRIRFNFKRKSTHELSVEMPMFVVQVSQTITRGGPRTQIAIPAQGMIEFRDALTDLLEEYGTDDGGFKGDLPEGRYMRVDSKNFYFDIGQNNRGFYMRISEVRVRVSLAKNTGCVLSWYCCKGGIFKEKKSYRKCIDFFVR